MDRNSTPSRHGYASSRPGLTTAAQCLATGREPTEAVIQATLDLIAVGQGPADPLALANTVSMVSQTPDVQPNTTVPSQGNSRSLNPTARAEVTGGSLYTAIADNSNICPTVTMSGCRPDHIGHTQHQANSFRMSANDITEQLVLRGTSDEDVPVILTQFRKRVELKEDLHVPPQEIDKRVARFLLKCSFGNIKSVNSRCTGMAI